MNYIVVTASHKLWQDFVREFGPWTDRDEVHARAWKGNDMYFAAGIQREKLIGMDPETHRYILYGQQPTPVSELVTRLYQKASINLEDK